MIEDHSPEACGRRSIESILLHPKRDAIVFLLHGLSTAMEEFEKIDGDMEVQEIAIRILCETFESKKKWIQRQ